MTTSSTIGIAALLVFLASAPVAAQRSWVEARGPHVTVISDASTGRARDVAWQFEQVREAMSRCVWPSGHCCHAVVIPVKMTAW